MFLPLCLAAAVFATKPAQAHQNVRVLLVGIGPYEDNKSLGLISLHGENDCHAMENALGKFFNVPTTSMHELLGNMATGAAIRDAFQNWLVKDAQPSDTMIFFYSGHGTVALDAQQKPCSAIVPIDAKRLPPKPGNAVGAFDPSSLITRDFFNPQIESLTRSGKGSNITLIFDSCDSGLAARGRAISKGAVNPAVDLTKDKGEGIDQSDLALGDSVLIGGAKIGTSAYESDTQQEGNLTLALVSALANHAVSEGKQSALSYQDLSDQVMVNMADLVQTVPQIPVFAGDLSRLVFGTGKVRREPYFVVTHRPNDPRPILEAGSIYGLSNGCMAVILDPSNDPKKPGIAAKIDNVTAYESDLILPPEITDFKSLYERHVKITDWAPDAAISLDVSEIQNVPQSDAILAKLKETKTVTLTVSGASVHLCAPGQTSPGTSSLPHDPGFWILCDQGGNPLGGGKAPVSTSPDDLGTWLESRMRDYGRRKAVERLSEPNPWEIVTMQIVPVRTKPSGGKEVVDSMLPVPNEARGGDSGRTFTPTPSDRIAIRVKATFADGSIAQGTAANVLADAPYIHVLDLSANGKVSALWPDPKVESPDRGRLKPDGNWYYLGTAGEFVDGSIPAALEAWKLDSSDGTGIEYFKLLATNEQLLLTPLLTAFKGDTRGASGPLSRILSAYRDGTLISRDASSVTPEPSRFAVDEVTFIINKP